MTVALEVEQLDARHGDLQALFGVSMAVEAGSTVAVIGANGAGKSTLLQAIAGTVPVAGGDVRFEGLSLRGVPVHHRVQRGISLVPEGRRIFPSLTVGENLEVGRYRRRRGRGRWPRWSRRFHFSALCARGRRPGCRGASSRHWRSVGR